MKTLPLPPLYTRGSATRKEHQANPGELQEEAAKYRDKHGFSQAGADKKRVHLLIIDDQYDFSFPDGTLFVSGRSGTGAMDAHQKLVEFIYKYLHVVSEITCTLDTHLPFQVFHPAAHLTEEGHHPDPFTVISEEDYKHGKYRPNPAMAKQLEVDPAWLQKQFTYYCQQLEATGKYALCIWPYHCLIGSPGHRLAGVVEEARLFHTFARGAANTPEIKGGNPLTEHYSIFRPEVTTCWDGKPIPGTQKNDKLIKTLLKADIVIMAGEAASHCVKTSIEDFLGEIKAQDSNLAKKVYIMRDCMDSVVIPNVVDYTDEANAALDKFADAGMHVVESTMPLEEWPDIDL